MTSSIRPLAFAGALFLLLPTAAAAQSSDREAVDQVMQTFMRAYRSADNTLAKQVFRSDGVMIGYSEARGRHWPPAPGNSSPRDSMASRPPTRRSANAATRSWMWPRIWPPCG